jgi:hypothetical protein
MVDGQNDVVQSVHRIKLWHVLLMAVFALFTIRAFYVQIVRMIFIGLRPLTTS